MRGKYKAEASQLTALPSCDTVLHTAFKQECRTIRDVECRIANLEDPAGGHHSRKICEVINPPDVLETVMVTV